MSKARPTHSRRSVVKTLGGVAAATVLPAAGLWSCGAPPRRDADVIVIGAGLSGLNSALLLQDEGFDVLVVEGSNRLGGRVHTLDDLPGHPEAGGTEIAESYARMRAMLARLGGLPMRRWMDTVELPFALNIDGQTLPLADWPASGLNKLVGPERNTGMFGPFALSGLYAPRPSPLEGLESWLAPEHAALDIPYADYLAARGASPEAIRLLDAMVAAPDTRGISALWQHRLMRFQSFVGNSLEGLERVATGASRVPEGMAALLKREPRYDMDVVALRSEDQQAVVRTRDGTVLRARFVVCTVPLTVLRTLQIEPALPALQAEAVRSIPYDNYVNVIFTVTAPYWEEDGLPGSTWSNTALGRVFRFNSDAGAYLWMNVNHAAYVGLDDDGIKARALAELHAARPSTVGRVEVAKVINWGGRPWTRGHNPYRAPGQIARFGMSYADAHGRIHFAGEHTAAGTRFWPILPRFRSM